MKMAAKRRTRIKYWTLQSWSISNNKPRTFRFCRI